MTFRFFDCDGLGTYADPMRPPTKVEFLFKYACANSWLLKQREPYAPVTRQCGARSPLPSLTSGMLNRRRLSCHAIADFCIIEGAICKSIEQLNTKSAAANSRATESSGVHSVANLLIFLQGRIGIAPPRAHFAPAAARPRVITRELSFPGPKSTHWRRKQ